MITAAGGVAWSHQRIKRAAAAVRLEVEPDGWERGPVGDVEILSIQMVDALWIALADMLTWVRTVDERTSRTHNGRTLGLGAARSPPRSWLEVAEASDQIPSA